MTHLNRVDFDSKIVIELLGFLLPVQLECIHRV